MIPKLFVATFLVTLVLMVVLLVMHCYLSKKLRHSDPKRARELGVESTAFSTTAYKLTMHLLVPGNTLPGIEGIGRVYRWLNYIYFGALIFLLGLFCGLIRAASGM